MALYKYLNAERVDVLDKLRIRITQPSALNDPFESLPMIEKIMGEGDFYSLINDQVEKSELRETVKETIEKELSPYKKIINTDLFESDEFIDVIMENFDSLTRPFIKEALNPENLNQSYSENFKESFSNTFGVLSLTQNPDNLLMWSHYCDSHRGFLIELDQNSSFFDQRINDIDTIRKLKNVQYINQRPQIDKLFKSEKVDRDDYLEEIMNLFFLTKSDAWAYEKEMRIVLPLESANETFEMANGERVYLINIPASIIKSVVYGSQINEKTQNRISEILNRDEFGHVNILRSELDMNNFKVNLIDA